MNITLSCENNWTICLLVGGKEVKSREDEDVGKELWINWEWKWAWAQDALNKND